MILNENISIAFQCPVCGNTEVQRITAFEILRQTGDIKCSRCHRTSVVIKKHRSFGRVTVPCPGCFSEHGYTITLGSLCSPHLQTHKCPISGETIMITGVYTKVAKMAAEIFIVGEYGAFYRAVESYGDVGDVLDVMEHLKNLAEGGRVLCECGECDIEIEIEGPVLRLLCPMCGAGMEIDISNIKSIENIKQKQKIILTK